MIVYREFSSLVNDLGISAKTLYSVSNRTERHYRKVTIPKKSGGMRELCVPDELLKTVQRRIAEVLLPLEPISKYASAYRIGGSTRRNARPHIGREAVLKLDVKNFFGNLIYPIVKEKAFPKERYSEQNRILLALLCTHNDALVQGAPTSPAISNIIMKDFDDTVGGWCRERGVYYTRYCDDMAFSGDFQPQEVIAKVRGELKKLGLFLNDKKTSYARQGQRQEVTGIIVNEKQSVPREYKKKIRQEMYFCRKYGIKEHLERTQSGQDAEAFARSLMGRINYVLSVEPQSGEMAKYKKQLKEIMNV